MSRKPFTKNSRNCIPKLSIQHSNMERFCDWFGAIADFFGISQWMFDIDRGYFEIHSSRY